MTETALLECVPNFSEGRDVSIIDRIVCAIKQVDMITVLHVDMGFDANRTVVTFVGPPDSIEEAAFQAVKIAGELIDMRHQTGTHPRLGATDVFPIIPLSNYSIEDTIALSYRISRRIANELCIPIYNYELSARSPERRRLETIRNGEYEGLKQKMNQDNWLPDYCAAYNASTGATILGARQFLLAYNINLATRDISIAKHIAAAIRESGQLIDGKRMPGLFTGVKAIGWDVPEYNMVQVSTNITDTNSVSLSAVYEKVKELASAYGIQTEGSELIGLCPLQCMIESGHYYKKDTDNETELITAAIDGLGLNSVGEFLQSNRIIEYLL